MFDSIIDWFMVLANAKIVSMLILFSTFSAIVIYVYGSKKRSERFETYRNIPFLEDDEDGMVPMKKSSQASSQSSSQSKGEK